MEKLHGLIVSCQALPGEAMYREEGGVMPLFAKAAFRAGASALRANSVRDICEMKAAVPLPIIGLIKRDFANSEVYITPSLHEVEELLAVGVDVLAVDGTNRLHPGGQSGAEWIAQLKEKYPKQTLMADISTLEEAKAAFQAGADYVSTTLNGYTKETAADKEKGPNLQLVKELVAAGLPCVAEGRIHTPKEAKQALNLGAQAVVVGGAITRPEEIARRFMQEIQ